MDTPYEVVHLASVVSTQDEGRARFGGRPVLVVADTQSAGRGRTGTRWEQADRAVAASLAFAPDWPIETWPRLTLVAGLAAWDAVAAEPDPPEVALKWPNDLTLGAVKVGGIIAEADGAILVIGFGLNLWWRRPIEEAGALWDDDPGPAAAPRIARRWAGALFELVGAGPASWPRERYAARCATLGREISWDGGTGRAVGIAADGGLEVDDGRGGIVLHAGAVRGIRVGT